MPQVKRALVTGGAGFVGTNLVKRLLKEGYQVVSIDNYYTGKKENHQEGCEYREYDITTITDYSAFGKFDVVYHLAALARIQPSFLEPDKCFKANCLGTFNVAKYCSDNNIPLVYAGSSSHHSGRYKNPYTFTKDVGEDIVTMFQQVYGLKASTTRFYNVYGPHHLKEGAYCTVIGIWEKAMEEHRPLLVTGDGLKRRDFTHINDIVDALYRIHDQRAWGHNFELGTGTNYSIREVAEMFEYDNINHIENRPGEAQITLCTDTLAKDVLGWEAKLKLQDYIQEFIKNVYTVSL
jgi:UDP-glucose 4-epimerase